MEETSRLNRVLPVSLVPEDRSLNPYVSLVERKQDVHLYHKMDLTER